jgi:hypothetical protein
MNRRGFIQLGVGAAVAATLPVWVLPAVACTKSLLNEQRIWQLWDDIPDNLNLGFWGWRIFPRTRMDVVCGTHGQISTLYCEDCTLKRHMAQYKAAHP